MLLEHDHPGRHEATVAEAPVASANTFLPEVWLLGQPPLRDYLEFVRHSVENGEQMDPRATVDEWRAANDYYHELETREAGLVEEAGCRELPEALGPLAETLGAHPHFRNAFDSLPVTLGMVELDRLIVYQPHVTLPFVEALRARLDPMPDDEGLFHFCLPLQRRDPPMTVRRMGSRRYAFVSDSTDFRMHEPALLRADQIVGYESFGPIGAAVGLVVGFGSNFLNVIRSGGRMMLNNGYHRVYALRAAGVTHAPAVIQTVTRRDELALVATQAVFDEAVFYFAAARPPLIKDFFDPRIRKVLSVRRMEKLIEVNFEVREYNVPRASC